MVRSVYVSYAWQGAWTFNNDGTPLPQGTANGKRSIVKDGFIHANDDAFKFYNSFVNIDNYQVWQFKNGAVFPLGWFPKTVSDVVVSSVDLLNVELWYNQGHNLGLVNYTSGNGSGTISDLTFNNINVGTNIARVIGLKASAQKFQNITFNNLVTIQHLEIGAAVWLFSGPLGLHGGRS